MLQNAPTTPRTPCSKPPRGLASERLDGHALFKPVLTRDSSSPSQHPQQQAVPSTHAWHHTSALHDTVHAASTSRSRSGPWRKRGWLRSLTRPVSIKCWSSRAPSSPDAAAPISLYQSAGAAVARAGARSPSHFRLANRKLHQLVLAHRGEAQH
eukprot:COSAG02_NODE_439_length_22308_cov_18.013508_11_plen_154_part_00